jgi:Spy/CpxP family protein refolding chaperone
LLVTGGVIGAVVIGPTFGQGWGPYGWHRGYDDGPGWRGEGRGWRGDGPGWRGWHGGPRHGGFFGGRMERMVDRALWSVDATREQRDKVTTIFERAADDVFALRAQHLEGRRQIREALAAPTVDRARIEAVRGDQMKLAETASKRITDAFADAAEVLTPEQRAQLARRIERWQRWFLG